MDIDPISTQSLRVEIMALGNVISSATGFIVQRGSELFLITNWHVVTGYHADTGELLDKKTAAIPDALRVACHAKAALGTLIAVNAPLYAGGAPIWLEHPLGRAVDVVAVPLIVPSTVNPICLDLYYGADVRPVPAMPAAIIGYPFGWTSAGIWPIWKTGHIATDPAIDYNGRPAFLIDATTREGMSGSPVMARTTGGYLDSKGDFVVSSRPVTKFLGIYSGRLPGDAEIGRVWRPSVLGEIFQHAGI